MSTSQQMPMSNTCRSETTCHKWLQTEAWQTSGGHYGQWRNLQLDKVSSLERQHVRQLYCDFYNSISNSSVADECGHCIHIANNTQCLLYYLASFPSFIRMVARCTKHIRIHLLVFNSASFHQFQNVFSPADLAVNVTITNLTTQLQCLTIIINDNIYLKMSPVI